MVLISLVTLVDVSTRQARNIAATVQIDACAASDVRSATITLSS